MKMIRTSVQAPSDVVMIRPHNFTVNTETASDNVFQQMDHVQDDQSRRAYDEIGRAVEALRSRGVRVHLFEDHGTDTPDSVFPNNWFSTHAGGHVAVYPMKAASRRRERRADIIEMLKSEYRVQDVIDYSGLEPDGLFLEGTGAMVLDHIDRVAYAVQSERTNPIALERFCTHFNFEPMVFSATDRRGVPIYHTNVLMCVATDYALVGLSLIRDSARRDEVAARLRSTGREMIELTEEQIALFAGNALELCSDKGRILVMSGTAYGSLTADQIAAIEVSTPIVTLDIPTIERAGGSVRCTIAGIHLSRRKG